MYEKLSRFFNSAGQFFTIYPGSGFDFAN